MSHYDSEKKEWVDDESTRNDHRTPSSKKKEEEGMSPRTKRVLATVGTLLMGGAIGYVGGKWRGKRLATTQARQEGQGEGYLMAVKDGLILLAHAKGEALPALKEAPASPIVAKVAVDPLGL